MHHKPITSTLCLGHLLKTWLSNFAYGPSQPKFYQVCMCVRCVVAYCGCGCLFTSRLAIERLAWGTAPGLDTVQLNVADQIPEIVFVWKFIGVFYTYSHTPYKHWSNDFQWVVYYGHHVDVRKFSDLRLNLEITLPLVLFEKGTSLPQVEFKKWGQTKNPLGVRDI